MSVRLLDLVSTERHDMTVRADPGDSGENGGAGVVRLNEPALPHGHEGAGGRLLFSHEG